MLAVICTFSGCKSIDQRVSGLVSKNEFERALRLLENAEAAAVPGPKVTAEAIAARNIYRSAAESYYLSQIQSATASGLARTALSTAEEAARLCEWSTSIAKAMSNGRRTVQRIDAFAIASKQLVQADATRDATARLLIRDSDLFSMLADSPIAAGSLEDTKRILYAHVCRELERIQGTSSDDLDLIARDAILAGLNPARQTELRSHLNSLAALLGDENAPSEFYRLSALTVSPDRTGDAGISAALVERIRAWSREEDAIDVLGADPSYKTIAALQRIYSETAPTEIPASLITAVITNRARRLAPDPSTAPLAWAYMTLGRHLAPTGSFDEVLSQEIMASLSARARRKLRISVEVSPTVDPMIQQLIFIALYQRVSSNLSNGVEWTWAASASPEADLAIVVDRGGFLTPSLAGLPERQSEYLSHYQDVPNPRKSQLKQSLAFSKSRVDSAERSYSFAVNSHNINPTQWSLTSANTAKTTYSLAVSSYNMLVSQYNLTPDTIREPVFLPYRFFEGTISQGFYSHGHCVVDGRSVPFGHESSASDFVRTGARLDDTNPSRRRNDSMDLETGASALLRHFGEVLEDVAADVASALCFLPPDARTPIEPTEEKILSWLTHPAGAKAELGGSLGVPEWLIDRATGFKLPTSEIPPPPIELQKATRPASDTSQQHAMDCLVQVIAQDSQGRDVSRGSGSFIGPDGLILTCAHVLNGPRVVVEAAPGRPRIEASIVFSNEKHDVALLRAAGAENEKWLTVSFAPVSRATEILALGFPSLGSQARANATSTYGTVATPAAESLGSPRIAADVTVASGSSGGPMIDRSTGDLVGVVTAVAKAGISDDRSASGHFCLAAPAEMLPAWLGLFYSLEDE